MIQVLVLHQTKLIARIIASVLSEEPDIHVVGTAATPAEAEHILRSSNCNMVLAAASLPDGGALAFTEWVAGAYPATKVLVIGVQRSEGLILEYIKAGASGYVLRDVPVDRLLDNLRAAHNDQALISPTIAAALMNQVAELAQISSQYELDPQALNELTPREREVLDLIGEGLTNQEIADRLVIEMGTVKNHVHSILKKLDVSSREEAASYLDYSDEAGL